MAEAPEAQQPPADASSATKPASIEFSTSNIPPLWDVGEVIWAKLEGYPWWPAQVADEAKLASPENSADDRPKDSICVFFFGDNNWGWVPRTAVLPFDDTRYPSLCAALSTGSAANFKRALKAARAEYSKWIKLPHGETCWHCHEGGELLCCDLCPAEYCFRCLSVPAGAQLSGDWACTRCYTLVQQVCHDQLQLLITKDSKKKFSGPLNDIAQNLSFGHYHNYDSFITAVREALEKVPTPEEQQLAEMLRGYVGELESDFRHRFPPPGTNGVDFHAGAPAEGAVEEFAWHEAEAPPAAAPTSAKNIDDEWEATEDFDAAGGEEDEDEDEFTDSDDYARKRGRKSTATGKRKGKKPMTTLPVVQPPTQTTTTQPTTNKPFIYPPTGPALKPLGSAAPAPSTQLPKPAPAPPPGITKQRQRTLLPMPDQGDSPTASPTPSPSPAPVAASPPPAPSLLPSLYRVQTVSPLPPAPFSAHGMAPNISPSVAQATANQEYILSVMLSNATLRKHLEQTSEELRALELKLDALTADLIRQGVLPKADGGSVIGL